MGADYQEVLGRLHNEAMIGKFVRMFLQDDSFQILEEALRRGDVKEAFRGAHTAPPARSPAADPSSTRQPRCCPEIRSPQYPILFSYRILNSFFLPVAAYS